MPVVCHTVQDPEPGARRSARALSIAMLAAMVVPLVLCGCGQRGLLYLPNGGPGSVAAPSAPLLSTPLFPAPGLTSDTGETGAPASSFEVQPAATTTDTNSASPDQPGLKLVPSQQ